MTLEEAREVAMSLHACATSGEGCEKCAYFKKGENSNCLNRLMLNASELITRMLNVIDYHYYPEEWAILSKTFDDHRKTI